MGFHRRGRALLDQGHVRALEGLTNAQVLEFDLVPETLAERMLYQGKVLVLDPLEMKVIGGDQGDSIGSDLGFEPGQPLLPVGG
jgi:hypothetical protein